MVIFDVETKYDEEYFRTNNMVRDWKNNWDYKGNVVHFKESDDPIVKKLLNDDDCQQLVSLLYKRRTLAWPGFKIYIHDYLKVVLARHLSEYSDVLYVDHDVVPSADFSQGKLRNLIKTDCCILQNVGTGLYVEKGCGWKLDEYIDFHKQFMRVMTEKLLAVDPNEFKVPWIPVDIEFTEMFKQINDINIFTDIEQLPLYHVSSWVANRGKWFIIQGTERYESGINLPSIALNAVDLPAVEGMCRNRNPSFTLLDPGLKDDKEILDFIIKTKNENADKKDEDKACIFFVRT